MGSAKRHSMGAIVREIIVSEFGDVAGSEYHKVSHPCPPSVVEQGQSLASPLRPPRARMDSFGSRATAQRRGLSASSVVSCPAFLYLSFSSSHRLRICTRRPWDVGFATRLVSWSGSVCKS